jgi:hypothetical protein
MVGKGNTRCPSVVAPRCRSVDHHADRDVNATLRQIAA